MAGRPSVRCPFHPNCYSRGYVYLHRLIKEVEIGRYLRRDKVVHHIDGNPKNCKCLNLKIETRVNHAKKHALDRGRKWYGFNCPLCEAYFERNAHRVNDKWKKGKQGPFCSQSCAVKAGNMIRNGVYFGKTKIVKRFKKFKRCVSKKRYHLKNTTL